MAQQLNYSFFIMAGRLEDDWQLSYYGPDNKPVAKNKISITTWNGQKPVTHAYPVTAFGSIAERLQRYTIKDSTVLLEGNLSASEYEYQGEKKHTVNYVVRNFTMIRSYSGDVIMGNEQQSSVQQQQQSIQQPNTTQSSGDVPF